MQKSLRNKNGQTLEEFLSAYDAGRYERPSVAADIAVFAPCEGGVGLLLIKRGDHPFIGQWALPGGFVDMDESLEDAAHRELMEETGVAGLALRQFYTFGDVGRDPRTRIISAGYFAVAPAIRPQAADDAADAAIFLLTPGRAHAKSDIRIALTQDEARLSAVAEYRMDALGKALYPYKIPAGEPALAADHAYVICRAVEALLQLPRAAVIRQLAAEGAPAGVITRSLAALDRAYGRPH